MKMASRYSNPTQTKRILDKFDLCPKHGFGQNFLVNDAIVAKILKLADVGDTDVILEVGPGIGTLTDALLNTASHVIAVEKDRNLPAVISYTLKDDLDRLSLIEKDALDLSTFDLEERGGGHLPNKLISNLPYSVAATLVLDYFAKFDSLQNATVMVQREVADRMKAKVGTKDYGAYSIKLSMYAEYAGSFPVTAENFMPKPHVDSSVIRLDRIECAEPKELVRSACIMADAAFFNRRKTILNSSAAYFSSKDGNYFKGRDAKEALLGIFGQCRIDPRMRGERLSKEEYLRLGKALLDSA